MSTSIPTRSLEECRQELLHEAQEQVKRLQSIDPTKRELADAAMEISERDMAIRQLHERFCWLESR